MRTALEHHQPGEDDERERLPAARAAGRDRGRTSASWWSHAARSCTAIPQRVRAYGRMTRRPPGRSRASSQAAGNGSPSICVGPAGRHLDPDLAAHEADGVARGRHPVARRRHQLHRAADPADDPAARQDEDVEQPVVGLDREARAQAGPGSPRRSWRRARRPTRARSGPRRSRAWSAAARAAGAGGWPTGSTPRRRSAASSRATSRRSCGRRSPSRRPRRSRWAGRGGPGPARCPAGRPAAPRRRRTAAAYRSAGPRAPRPGPAARRPRSRTGCPSRRARSPRRRPCPRASSKRPGRPVAAGEHDEARAARDGLRGRIADRGGLAGLDTSTSSCPRARIASTAWVVTRRRFAASRTRDASGLTMSVAGPEGRAGTG